MHDDLVSDSASFLVAFILLVSSFTHECLKTCTVPNSSGLVGSEQQVATTNPPDVKIIFSFTTALVLWFVICLI